MFFICFLGWAVVCCALLCLCRPFCIFERCLDSNPERCRSKKARYQLSHPSPFEFFVDHNMDFSFSGWQCSRTWPMPAWAAFLEPFILSGWLTYQLASSEKNATILNTVPYLTLNEIWSSIFLLLASLLIDVFIQINEFLWPIETENIWIFQCFCMKNDWFWEDPFIIKGFRFGGPKENVFWFKPV